jgi:iron complex transport system ATP-binding protein
MTPVPPVHPALRTFDLAVGYRVRRARRAVLEHVNLSVRAGELVCLLGPNGIGKSTLLRTLARMQPALWGTVELGGADLRSITQTELARRIGVVLTEPAHALPVASGRTCRARTLSTFRMVRPTTTIAHDASSLGDRRVRRAHLAERDFNRLSDRRAAARDDCPRAGAGAALLARRPTDSRRTRVELMAPCVSSRVTERWPSSRRPTISSWLRTADVIWLPDARRRSDDRRAGRRRAGRRRRSAFEGRQIRFHPEERSFRLLTGNRGEAVVLRSGLRAALAAAVLEREGYAGVKRAETAASETCALAVHVQESGWHALTEETECSGADFASLAAFLRGRMVAA